LTTLNYGIIGCGMMGREHIQNIQLLKDTRIAAIVEPNLEMQQRAKALAPDARFVESISELLTIQEIDCLVIASPNFMHVDQLKEIATLRALPVLVEKPLGTDEAQKVEIAELTKNYPAPIWVAMELNNTTAAHPIYGITVM